MPPDESTALKSSFVAQSASSDDAPKELERSTCDFRPPSYRPGQQFRWYQWAIVVVLDVIGPFSTDSYIPNLPEMISELSTDNFMAGMTIQINWLVTAFATIIVGILADDPRVGRRGAVLGSLVLYCIGCFGSGASASIGWLIFFRGIQAVGISSCIGSTAIARDVLDDQNERMRMLALLGSLQPIAIVTAPAVGGLIGAWVGWRTFFYCLGLLGVAIMGGTYFLLPETLPELCEQELRTGETEDKERAEPPLGPKCYAPGAVRKSQIEKNACAPLCDILSRLVWKEHEARACIGVFLFGFCAVFSMLANISLVLEDPPVSLSTTVASCLIGSIPLAIITANGGVAIVSKYYSNVTPISIVGTSLWLMAASSIVLFLVSLLCIPNPFLPGSVPVDESAWGVMIAFYMFNFAQGMSIPPTVTLFMEPFADCAGLASGLRNSIQTIGATFASAGSTMLFDSLAIKGLLSWIGGWLAVAAVWGWLHLGFCPRSPTTVKDVSAE